MRPSLDGLAVLLMTTDRFDDHDVGRGHPERPERLGAVLTGAAIEGVRWVEPRPATVDELVTVHTLEYVEALERFCRGGGGAIDADTGAVGASWDAAVLAAGAGLDAIERLDAGEADAAFCAVRPPGHHATPTRAMGFCLLNSAAIAAAVLADRGERVLVLDWDAHHGNGTQDAFWDDPRVLYVSLHEYPLYPGTGRLTDVGDGTTLNLPLPAGATGDVYLHAMDEVVAPAVEAFGPTWLLVSAGFDAHRADPLTGLGLSAGDFGDLTRRAMAFAPAGRRLLLLEGGYDLGALEHSTAACLSALLGVDGAAEAATNGGPGHDVVDAAKNLLRRGH